MTSENMGMNGDNCSVNWIKGKFAFKNYYEIYFCSGLEAFVNM